MKELISLIAEMHEREYIHFDIKPHNILFTSLGIMQLCDGGLSCCIQDICSIKSLTRGTEGYMAPEVLSGDTLMHPYAVDMYSVGVTLAHLRRVVSPFLIQLYWLLTCEIYIELSRWCCRKGTNGDFG